MRICNLWVFDQSVSPIEDAMPLPVILCARLMLVRATRICLVVDFVLYFAQDGDTGMLDGYFRSRL